MKKKILTGIVIAGSIFSLASTSMASPEKEKAFVDEYKKAFEGKEQAKLEALLYTKDANPEALSFYKMMISADMGNKISDIKLRDLTPEEKNKVAEGVDGPNGKAKFNITPTKKLVISTETKGATGSSKSTSESYIAENEGKLVMPVPGKTK